MSGKSAAAGRTLLGRAARFFPILDWARAYRLSTLTDDLLAAGIVTVMLIPQSLAYALLAGLPPQVGLYASILPLLAYTLFGTSRALAVGPVAIVSLMTASALAGVAPAGSPAYLAGALVLALLSGLMLLAMGLLRLGIIANFLSHPVISGFIAASAILIAASQVKHIIGVPAGGETLYELLRSLAMRLDEANAPTVLVGMATLTVLTAARVYVNPLLVRSGVSPRTAGIVSKLAPMVAVIGAILVSQTLALAELGVRVVGEIPQGVPPLTWPDVAPAVWVQLAGPAALISMIGFVESVSVAQTLAAKRRQRIDPNQELVALGAANVAAGFGGGYPVTGGFARSVVNFDAGAQTPAAGAFAALGIAVATVLLTTHLFFLPQAVLAATIIVAVLSLVDLSVLRRTWKYSKKDFAAVAVTILVTLSIGVEAGVMAGVGISLVLFLYRTSRPHIAIVGLVPGTEHFRNVLRHRVKTSPHILSLRVDESLYFANARFLEERLYAQIAQRPELRDVVLVCSAVNEIDASALESLETINRQLDDSGVKFHLSEVKGPVMDQLQRSDFLDHLTGEVFLSHYQAVQALDPDLLLEPSGQAQTAKEHASEIAPAVTAAS
jgi:SulP family sulfate permease